jgi:hypothetical protein
MNINRMTVKQRQRIRVCILALGISTNLAACLLAFSETQASGNTKAEGVYYIAYRTPAHVTRSSPDVFHGVSADMLDLLKNNNINVIADPERGTIETNELFSLESLLSLTKSAGATSLLYLTVDRPAVSWLKLTLQCYDLSGKLLWEEHATASGGLSGKNAPSKTVENLKKKLQPRIGQPGLPRVKKPEQVAVLVKRYGLEQVHFP